MCQAQWQDKCIKIGFVRKKFVRKKNAHREIAHSENDFVFVRKNVVRKKSAHREIAHKIFGKVIGLGSKGMPSKKNSIPSGICVDSNGSESI